MAPGIIESSQSRVVIKEDSYLTKIVDPSNTAEYDACLRLRHDYFVKQRHWVPDTGSGKESDHYDPYCQHLAVFHNNDILAYVRLLPWQEDTGFMLEHDFACLLTDDERNSIIRHNSVELSRLVVSPKAYRCDKSHTLLLQDQAATAGAASSMSTVNGNGNGVTSETPALAALTPHVLELLLKLLYHTSLQQGIDCYYIVVEPVLLKILQRKFGIPFRSIGKGHINSDGTRTVVGFTTLDEIECSVQRRWPQKYQWYRQLL